MIHAFHLTKDELDEAVRLFVGMKVDHLPAGELEVLIDDSDFDEFATLRISEREPVRK